MLLGPKPWERRRAQSEAASLADFYKRNLPEMGYRARGYTPLLPPQSRLSHSRHAQHRVPAIATAFNDPMQRGTMAHTTGFPKPFSKPLTKPFDPNRDLPKITWPPSEPLMTLSGCHIRQLDSPPQPTGTRAGHYEPQLGAFVPKQAPEEWDPEKVFALLP